MTKKVRLKIAYWFFLMIGMIGVSMQLYKYYKGELDLSFGEGALTLFLGMFVFKPMLLLDLLDDVRVKFLGAKMKVFKTDSTPIDDDEDSDA